MTVDQLAKKMDVTSLDVESFLASIANSLSDDGAVEYFLKADEKERTEMIEAYAAHAANKAQNFLVSYLSNPEKKAAFDKVVVEVAFDG